MLKNIITLGALFLSVLVFSNEDHKSNYFLTKDFDKAIVLSKVYQRPLVLLFTGSDWDEASAKLIEEVKTSKQFAKLEKQAIFVWLDFPEIQTILPEQIKKNFFLKERLNIKQFPQIVLLDEAQEVISRIGVLSDCKTNLSMAIEQKFDGFYTIQRFLQDDSKEKTSEEVKKLYTLAQQLGIEGCALSLQSLGVEIEKDAFFKLEKHLNELSLGLDDKALRNEILCKGTSEQLFRLALVALPTQNKELLDNQQRLLSRFANVKDKSQLTFDGFRQMIRETVPSEEIAYTAEKESTPVR